MIAYNFRTSRNDAGGQANEGHWELALSTPAKAYAAARLSYRAHRAPAGERVLLDHLHATLGAQFPHSLITSYYIALKAHQFVALTGRPDSGKFAFASAFARALIGAADSQLVVIDSNGWVRRSANLQAHDLHARFESLQFRQVLQEAMAPEQSGKLIFLLLRGLAVDEVEYYARRLLQIDPDGTRRLALTGFPADNLPVLPPNVMITATMHLSRRDHHLEAQTLRHVSPIALPAGLNPGAEAPITVPPVGLQRMLLAAAVRGNEARDRLEAILGAGRLRMLRPSASLAALLWRLGIPSDASDTAILNFVANSFTADGHGLFAPSDPWRNARRACDVAALQHALCHPACSSRMRREFTSLLSA
ncbi:MAG: hypothetical protein HC822_00185 [Oscillochloris sp.]|nr:hypothetical protein [Oscillochloris sp.]